MSYSPRLALGILCPLPLAIACMAFAPGDLMQRSLLSLFVASSFGLILAYWLAEKNEFDEKYRNIFSFSPDYMLVGRISDGKIIEVNQGLEPITGFKPSDVIGQNTIDLGVWEEPAHRTIFMEQLRQKGSVREMPTRLIRRDGIRRDITISANIFQLRGEPHYIAVVRDVTENIRTQRELAASETRLKAIFEASPAPIAINRLSDLTYMAVNPAWEALYGLDSRQVIGKTPVQCGLIAQDIDNLRTQTGILLAKNRLDGASVDFLTPSGRHISIIYSSRIVEIDGEPAMVSINTDISQLRETENRLKAIVEAAPIPITITRRSDHRYLQVNAEFERMARLPADQIIGKNLREVGFRSVNSEFLRLQTEQLLAHGQVDNEQGEFIAPDGRCLTLMYSSRIIELNGEPAIITIATDITQLKEVETGLRLAEAARMESEARFIALFQSSPIALGVFRLVNKDYVASELNAAWYRNFGYHQQEIIGHTTVEIGLWSNEQDRRQLLAAAKISGEVHDFECWLRKADGSNILCSVSCNLIHSGDQHLLLIAYLDITEKHEIERKIRQLNAELESRIQDRTRELQIAQAELIQSEKMASLGSLVAGIAHELNTPIGNSLTVATTLTDRSRNLREMMQSGMRRSTLETYLDDTESGSAILSRNLQRAAELIQSFKSIAVDQSSDARRPFDLHQTLQETLVALGPSLKKKPYTIHLEVEEGLSMDSYPGPLEQVVVNLINNAILHGFDGRDHGQIEIRGTALDSEHVQLCIADNGVGISENNLARIFDPFFTTKMGKGGSGLGLHIVRNIVETDLGGNIVAKSQAGFGTCMEIRLPRHAPANTESIS